MKSIVRQMALFVIIYSMLVLATLLWSATQRGSDGGIGSGGNIELAMLEQKCNATGGFLTLTDGLPECTRLRSGGMMQL